jgi:hypothetical protein
MDTKMKLSGLLITPVMVSVFFFFGFQLRSQSEDKVSDKLKQRVTEFYTAVQANQIEKAAPYVTEKARDSFKTQSHGKFTGFEITHVEMEQDGQSAIVELSFKVLIPTIIRQVYMPDRARWKLVSGEWFYDPENVPPQLGDKFKEYYYDKHPAGNAQSSEAKNGTPTVSSVSFERDLIDIGLVDKGKVVNLRFPFTNQSSQEIRIEEFHFRGVSFLKSTTTKTAFKPGEKGEISVDLDTTELSGVLDNSFFVEFQPIKEMVSLRVKGKVSVKQKADAPKPAKSFTPSSK